MFQQTAKPSSLPDLGKLDPGEEDVDRQLLHPEEMMNLGPCKVIFYKFSSRAPPVSADCNDGSSQTPALPDDGSVMGMMARSARYWVRRETPRCWVKGCTCACSRATRRAEREEGHPARSRVLARGPGEEDSSTSMRGGLFLDEDNDGSTGDSSDDERRRFAEEYSLVPLSRRKQYSAQTFHDAVERFLRGF
ncbi:hypothetical protein TURU_156221 [Turdus rufiventris]|nr:hypothetical protein TURU_156221 [Turdus rufiventris]